jgi:hypothetical protein
MKKTAAAMDDEVPFIDHSHFKSGLPRGQFRVVVNPALARPYIVHRLHLNAALIVFIALGAALAMAGIGLAGLLICAAGVIASRLTRQQAPRIILQLAQNDPKVYAEVTTNGVLEVRRAGA